MVARAKSALNRRRRPMAAWVAMLAILFQSMLPSLHALAMSGSLMPSSADGIETVVICTPSGFKRVALGDLPAPGSPAQPAPTKAPYCPMCQAVQATATAIAPAVAAACDAPLAVASAAFPPFDARLIGRAHPSGLQPRAPPPVV
ncbi:MAG: hypothetical protein IT562_09340 [Alphaproteobacteria bacterium]|nr:hypothetical protein [Alphaproteobacteria bacterium]